MKKNKKLLKYSLIFLGVLVLLGVLYFSSSQSIISTNVPLTVKQDTWQGNPIKITTPYLGTLSANRDSLGDYVQGASGYVSICGLTIGTNSKEGVIISNSYSSSQELTLSSSMSSQSTSCSDQNYITMETTLPKGVLTINYDGKWYAHNYPVSYLRPSIIINGKEFKIPENPAGVYKGQSYEKTGTYALNLTKDTDVKVQLLTGSDGYGSSSSITATLTFTPSPSVSTQPISYNESSSSQSGTTSNEPPITGGNTLSNSNRIWLILSISLILFVIIVLLYHKLKKRRHR